MTNQKITFNNKVYDVFEAEENGNTIKIKAIRIPKETKEEYPKVFESENYIINVYKSGDLDITDRNDGTFINIATSLPLLIQAVELAKKLRGEKHGNT